MRCVQPDGHDAMPELRPELLRHVWRKRPEQKEDRLHRFGLADGALHDVADRGLIGSASETVGDELFE